MNNPILILSAICVFRHYPW